MSDAICTGSVVVVYREPLTVLSSLNRMEVRHPKPHQIEGDTVDVHSYPACDAELEPLIPCRHEDIINESRNPLDLAS